MLSGNPGPLAVLYREVSGAATAAARRATVLITAEPATPAAEPATRFDTLFERLYPGLFGLTYRVLGDRWRPRTRCRKPSCGWPMHPYCNVPTTR